MRECKIFVKGSQYEIWKIDVIPSPKFQPILSMIAICTDTNGDVAMFKVMDVLEDKVVGYISGYIHFLTLTKHDITEYSIIHSYNVNYMVIADKDL